MTLSFSSCVEQLDIPQKSKLSTSEYYKTAGPEEAEQLIAAVYKQFYMNIKGHVPYIFLDVLSDDHFVGGGSLTDNSDDHRYAYNFTYSTSHKQVRDQYNWTYRIIYFCNMIIEQIPDSDDPVIKRVKAEADFFRAFCMFEAMRWWGTPPLVTKVATTEEERYPSNGDPKEIITWCLERMQAAADNLPAIAGKGQQRSFGGRVSKHAALAFKGKMALWYGQKYNDKEVLSQAIAPLKEVISSGLYGLVEDMSILGKAAADFCMEYILEHDSADNDGYPKNQADNWQLWITWRPELWNKSILPSAMHTQGGWGFSAPTGDFGDFLKEHEGGVDKPRFLAHIRTYNQILEMPCSDPSSIGIGSELHDCQGYFRWQDIQVPEDVYDITGFWKYSMANASYMRYGELLLLYAEAQFLNSNDADGSGLAALNQVRQRAELAPLGSMTYQDIKDERRAELWGQHERYFDLVRWGEAATKMADKSKVDYIFKGLDANGNFIVEEQPGTGSGWNDKFNLLPFPEAQIIANPNLKQNPGW